MPFRGEDKITFYTIMGVYSEAIISVCMIPLIGIGFALVVMGASVPLTLLGVNYYKLVLDKRLRTEVGVTPFWSGWIIDKAGAWLNVEFGVNEKEEIDINDKEMVEYEKSEEFSNSLSSIMDDNEDIRDLIEKNNLRDTYTDSQLSPTYVSLGLVTSRQLYAFEMIMAFFEINDTQLEDNFNYIKSKTLDVTTGVFIELTQDNVKTLTEFQKILYFMYANKMKNKPLNMITELLETYLNNFGITDKIAYNTQKYKEKTMKLHDVEKIERNPQIAKKTYLTNIVPILLAILSLFITIFLVSYIKSTIMNSITIHHYLTLSDETSINIYTALAFIPIIIGFIVSIKLIRRTQKIASEPYSIQFNNIMTKRFAFDNYCEIRKRLRQYASDARIYKVYPNQKHRKLWNNDYIIVILPASYQDSLDFDTGRVFFQGYMVDAMVTPVVMLDVGEMYGTIPVFLMIACTYHFKKFTKIFYTNNLRETWRNKVYLHIIATIQAKSQTTKADNDALKVRITQWQEWAIDQAQQFAEDKERRQQELYKINMDRGSQSPDGSEGENGDNVMENGNKNSPVQKKNVVKILLIVTVIALALVIFFGMLLPTFVKPV